MTDQSRDIAVIGGGFAGLSAAYELALAGHKVTVFEADAQVGGLAASFPVEGELLDRFYHHWFTNDLEVMGLIDDLGMSDDVIVRPSNTGVYYANNFFKLSTPMDLLRFTPLPFFDRIRLGLLALRARRVDNWMALEDQTAAEWLRSLGGEKVYNVVWEPLLKGKFGAYADEISAVWFWNKLKLRGGSRGKKGEENLAYFKGGFARLTEKLAATIAEMGGSVRLNAPVDAITPAANGAGWEVRAKGDTLRVDQVVATPALPLVADMVKEWASPDYIKELTAIDYLANVCLVLELDRSLSDTYWLNVNDPRFPFVGVIEHTNFESPESYGGRHIVYLSKYLPHDDALYAMSADEMLEFALPHIQRMFPKFDRDWLVKHHLWRARWSQPVVRKAYSKLIPANKGPRDGFWLCSMAQVYPEDRGTNYAIRDGRKMGRELAAHLAADRAAA